MVRVWYNTSMQDILFITGNRHKAAEAQRVLNSAGIRIVSRALALPEVQADTQEEIVKIKAENSFRLVRAPLIVDDTAFFLKDFPDFPGIYTSFVIKRLGLEGFSKLYDDHAKAYFKTLVAYIDAPKEIYLFEGRVDGALTKSPSPKEVAGAPLSRIFVPDGYNKPLIELPSHLVSHRAKALEALGEFIEKKK